MRIRAERMRGEPRQVVRLVRRGIGRRRGTTHDVHGETMGASFALISMWGIVCQVAVESIRGHGDAGTQSRDAVCSESVVAERPAPRKCFYEVRGGKNGVGRRSCPQKRVHHVCSFFFSL